MIFTFTSIHLAGDFDPKRLTNEKRTGKAIYRAENHTSRIIIWRWMSMAKWRGNISQALVRFFFGGGANSKTWVLSLKFEIFFFLPWNAIANVLAITQVIPSPSPSPNQPTNQPISTKKKKKKSHYTCFWCVLGCVQLFHTSGSNYVVSSFYDIPIKTVPLCYFLVFYFFLQRIEISE